MQNAMRQPVWCAKPQAAVTCRLRLSILLTLGSLAAPVHAGALDAYLPDRTEAVIVVQVKELFAAPLFKDQRDELKQLVRSLNLAPKVLDPLGIDPFENVARLVVAVPGNIEQDRLALLVQGSFDTAKVQAAAEKLAKAAPPLLKVHTIGSHTLYEVPLAGQVDAVFFALLDQGLLLASADRDLVLEGLDKKAGKRKPAFKKELQQLLDKAEPKHLLAVSSLSRPLTAFGLTGNVVNLVQGLNGGIAIADEIQIEFTFSTREVQAAKSVAGQLEDALNQARAIVAVCVSKEKRLSSLAELLDAVKVATQGGAVSLRLTIGKELIEKSLKKDPK